MRRVLVGVALVPLIASASWAATGPPIRFVRPVDHARHTYPASYFDWWRLHAVDPKTGRWLLMEFQPEGALWINVFDGEQVHGTGRQVLDPDDTTLRRTAKGWDVDLDNRPTVRGHLSLVGRSGVTVGPWRLGWQFAPGPLRWEHGKLWWSAVVPAGRLDGSFESYDGYKVDLSGWRGYLGHTWGKLILNSRAYQHWDFAAKHTGPRESWLLHGLEPRPGRDQDLRWWKPRDRVWQGVLVHTTARGVRVCRPKIVRRGWFTTYSIGLGDAGPYPARVTARCGSTSVSFRIWHADFKWGDENRTHYWIGKGPTPDRRGFIQHILPAE